MLTLVANGESPSKRLLSSLVRESDGLIAVDGGLQACDHAGMTPDIIFGDFDSASPSLLEKYAHVPQVATPDQEKSDLVKAVEYLFNFPFDLLTVSGALGKRIDHTLANICLLSCFPGRMKFVTDSEICFAIPKAYTLTCYPGQTLSLIPISTLVTGITTEGLKWELKNATLKKDFVGISNICCAEQVSICFGEGDLLVSIIRPHSVG